MTTPHRASGNLYRRVDILAARITRRQPPAEPVDVETVKRKLLAALGDVDPARAATMDPAERYIRLHAIRAMLRERVERGRGQRGDMSSHGWQ